MTAIKSIPGTMNNRRHVPYGMQAGACSLKVPVWTADPEGELLEGRFYIPTRLAKAGRNTNERHEFDNLVRQALQRWAEWREKRGWKMNSTPQVKGPFDIPTRTERDETSPDEKMYCAYARFVRTGPAFIKLDDLLYERDLAAKYGIDLEADRLPWNLDGNEDSGWVDPVKYAEEHRAKHGIVREDYLYPEDAGADAIGPQRGKAS